MKKTLILILIVFSFLIYRILPVRAQDSTESASENKSDIQRIQELKEKVAEKVAQLKIVQKNIYKGGIKKIEEENITLNDKTNQEKIIQVDNATEYYWINTDGKKLKLTIKDFTVKDYLIAWGEINKSSGVMKAEVISGRYPQYVFICTFEKILETEEILTCDNPSNNFKEELIYSEDTEIKAYQEKKDSLEKMDFLGLRKGEIIMVKGYKKNINDFKINLNLILSLGLPVPTPGE